MVAPHFHTTAEAKKAISKVSHNSGDPHNGPPTGIKGGSGGNETVTTPGVSETHKGSDWVAHRGIKAAK